MKTKTKEHYLSLKKYTAENINSKIDKVEEEIKRRLSSPLSPFVNIEEAHIIADNFKLYATLKDVRQEMSTGRYEEYEKVGKPMPYEDWRASFDTQYHNS